VSEAVRLFDEFDYRAGSWPRAWRVQLKAAVMALGQNSRFIVTSLPGLDACTLYKDIYCARGQAKMLFNVLKNDCCVEELQLGSIERIERALALYLVVAWRIAYLMRLGRTCPDLDAKLFFDLDEIQAAYLLNKSLAPPAPRLNEVLRMIARAGGFLARKSDGEPGAKTIWDGLRDVRASAHTIKTLREMGLLSSCV
jgi:hypothetical protein